MRQGTDDKGEIKGQRKQNYIDLRTTELVFLKKVSIQGFKWIRISNAYWKENEQATWLRKTPGQRYSFSVHKGANCVNIKHPERYGVLKLFVQNHSNGSNFLVFPVLWVRFLVSCRQYRNIRLPGLSPVTLYSARAWREVGGIDPDMTRTHAFILFRFLAALSCSRITVNPKRPNVFQTWYPKRYT